MTDIIIPKKLDLIKSEEMHGHLTIDIHNTRSGFTERYEQHNTVTTAANEYMWLSALAYLRNGSADRPSNIWTGLLGGVCLFSDTIAGGTMLPLGAIPLIGYAGTSTTVSGNRGVYNSTESSTTDTSATSVWDWGTSQANGTIASVARTHVNAGNGNFSRSTAGYGYAMMRPQDDTSTYFFPIGIDKANEKIYLYKGGKYYVGPYETTLNIKSGALNSLYRPRYSSYNEVICSTSVSALCQRWLDVDNQKIYAAIVTTGGTNTDGVVTIYSVDLTADSPSETSTAVTLSGCYLETSTGYGHIPVISNRHVYIFGWNPSDTSDYGVYIMNLSDNSVNFYSVTQMLSAAGYTLGSVLRLAPWRAGGASFMVYYSSSYYEVIIQEDGSFLFGEPNMSTGNSQSAYSGMGLGNGADAALAHNHPYPGNSLNYASDQAYILLPYDFLGTYCNLDSTITKTSSDTMKLSYTLSDS